jgi:hypothetical protein
MGLAIDTILASAVNPGAGPAVASVAASGDSLAVRNFAVTDQAFLELITRMGTTAGFAQVRSPLFHDNVRGIRVTPAESPSVFGLPGRISQPLQPQDNLIVELSGGAAETDVAALHAYYTNLPGAAARLHSWGEVQSHAVNIKPVSVAVTSSATIGAWSDTLITTSENLLKANTDYALVGYMSNTSLAVVGIKGSDTGNLRICGPGTTQEFPVTDYFGYMADRTGRPWIPVINAANVNNTFVSVAAATASVAAVVELIFLQLTPGLS